MRLYLNADSKNGIGYTPDTLIICNNDVQYEFDIQGDVDYDKPGLKCRVKGILAIRDNETDEYVELDENGYKFVTKLLCDPNSIVVIAIYPDSEYEQLSEELDSDEVNGYGEFCYEDDGYSFEFKTVFYGI